MKMTFCVACMTTVDLQHHHIVTKAEGGTDDPTNLITLCTACHHKLHRRQMNGAYSHSQLVKAGQAKRRAITGKGGGRKSYAERDPVMVATAKRLRQQGQSLRAIAVALASQGYTNKRGGPFSASNIISMVEGLTHAHARQTWTLYQAHTSTSAARADAAADMGLLPVVGRHRRGDALRQGLGAVHCRHRGHLLGLALAGAPLPEDDDVRRLVLGWLPARPVGRQAAAMVKRQPVLRPVRAPKL